MQWCAQVPVGRDVRGPTMQQLSALLTTEPEEPRRAGDCVRIEFLPRHLSMNRSLLPVRGSADDRSRQTGYASEA